MLEVTIIMCDINKCILVITGDFNCDFLTRDKDVSDFVSLINSYNIKHTIQEPTHITVDSASCIDNILTNCEDFVNSVKINIMISDQTTQKLTLLWDRNSINVTLKKRIFGT